MIRSGFAGLQLAHAAEIVEHALLRLLAHRAGVEQDDVGVLGAVGQRRGRRRRRARRPSCPSRTRSSGSRTCGCRACWSSDARRKSLMSRQIIAASRTARCMRATRASGRCRAVSPTGLPTGRQGRGGCLRAFASYNRPRAMRARQTTIDEQGLHPRRRHRGRGRRRSEEASPLPAGSKNYMTPGGFARLKDELDRLVDKERPRARGHGLVGGRQRRPLGKRRLHLRQEAPARNRSPHPLSDQAARRRRSRRSAARRDDDDADQMFFGATVTVRDARGDERTISIVGVDEIDTARGYISWVSPMARALIKAREGDTVTLQHAGRCRGARGRRSRYEALATGEPAACAAAVDARERALAWLTRCRATPPIVSSWTPNLPGSSTSSPTLLAHTRALRAANESLRRELARAQERNRDAGRARAAGRRRGSTRSSPRDARRMTRRDPRPAGRRDGHARRFDPRPRVSRSRARKRERAELLRGGRIPRSRGCARSATRGKIAGAERIAVMAALNIAHELLRERKAPRERRADAQSPATALTRDDVAA